MGINQSVNRMVSRICAVAHHELTKSQGHTFVATVVNMKKRISLLEWPWNSLRPELQANKGSTSQIFFLSVLRSSLRVVKLRLPSRLSQWQAEGHKFYINVYAINSSTNLSSSFTPLVMHSPPLCLQRRPVTRVWVKLRPVTYVLHWLNDIAFDWPRNFHDAAMFLQPCRRPRNREFLYNLEIFQQ